MSRLNDWLERFSPLIYLALIFLGAVAIALLGWRLDVESKQRAEQIQQSRLEACRGQNARHDATLHQLRVLTGKAKKDATPARRRMIDQNYQSTVLFINALVPKVDCVARITPPPVKGKSG